MTIPVSLAQIVLALRQPAARRQTPASLDRDSTPSVTAWNAGLAKRLNDTTQHSKHATPPAVAPARRGAASNSPARLLLAQQTAASDAPARPNGYRRHFDGGIVGTMPSPLAGCRRAGWANTPPGRSAEGFAEHP